MVSRNLLLERLAEILVRSFEVERDAIEPSKTFKEIGMDSLAVVDLVDFLERNLSLKIDDDEFHADTTIDHALEILQARETADNPAEGT